MTKPRSTHAERADIKSSSRHELTGKSLTWELVVISILVDLDLEKIVFR